MDIEQTETFASVETLSAALQRLGVSLPLRVDPAYAAGDIIDAAGEIVLQADPGGARGDEDVEAIATLVVMAVNLAAGQLVQAVR